MFYFVPSGLMVALMWILVPFCVIYLHRKKRKERAERQREVKLITDAHNAFKQWQAHEISFEEYQTAYKKQWKHYDNE
jgi:hypothetical protein